MRFSLLALLTLAGACDGAPADTTDAPNDDTGPSDTDTDELSATEQQEKDIADYEALTVELEANRSEFLDEHYSAALLADGDKLYWVDDHEWDYTVASWDSTTDTTLAYDFVIGQAYDNYVFSNRVIATARQNGQKIDYDVYDVDARNTLLDTLEIDAPTDGQMWYAYAAFGGDLYIAPTQPEPVIQRWTPGGGAPRELFSFADLGVDVGEFWGFGLDADHLIFAESGRMWSVDLATEEATWLENDTEVSGPTDLRSDGVLFSTADTLEFWSFTDGARDVGAEIQAADYQLSKTFSTAHLPTGWEFSRYKQWIVYHAEMGIFAWNMDTGKIVPILLEPRGLPRIVYQNPQVLDDGTIFVEGLVSESGSVGYDGPIYRVDTSALD